MGRAPYDPSGALRKKRPRCAGETMRVTRIAGHTHLSNEYRTCRKIAQFSVDIVDKDTGEQLGLPLCWRCRQAFDEMIRKATPAGWDASPTGDSMRFSRESVGKGPDDEPRG